MLTMGQCDTSITGRHHVDIATTIDDSQADITLVANGLMASSGFNNTATVVNNFPTDIARSRTELSMQENYKTTTHQLMN